MFEGAFNCSLVLHLVSLHDSLDLLHVVSDLLSIWCHLSCHGSVSLLQVLLERMGGVSPDATHVLNLSHVDVNGQLSGLDDAHKSDDARKDFHFCVFFRND